MKIAIFESIITPGGHEVEFDRILVDELTKLGHEVSFLTPQNFTFKYDYGVPTHYLPGDAVSYTGAGGLRKKILSLKREINRQRWYGAVYEQIGHQNLDAVIVPTATYRYLRGLNMSKLKNSPKPVIFIIHGVNPGEAPKLLAQMEKLKPYPNIKAAVITLSKDIFGKSLPNITCLLPPTHLPRDLEKIPAKPAEPDRHILKIGFFGQYRREKKLDEFLNVFIRGNYNRKIKLYVQGATADPADQKDIERIMEKYAGCEYIEFLNKWFVNIEWQKQIAAMDVLLIPYAAPRYRYHWGGMLFTAIGYKKPVIMSDEINPEISAQYNIGMTYPGGGVEDLQKTVENFINTYDEKAALYAAELERAYQDYHPGLFAAKIAGLVF